MKYGLRIAVALVIGLTVSGCKSDTISNDTFAGSDPVEPQFGCRDGIAAGEYSCRNIELYSQLTPQELMGSRLNDIWGWTDPQTGREYALVGLTDGVTFVDITNPNEPVVLGKLPESTGTRAKTISNINPEMCGLNLMQAAGFSGEGSTWRDMKVYKDHLYVVSDGQNHGMQVFDLAKLREVEDSPATFSHDVLYEGIANAHNIVINEESGFAYAVGATNSLQCSEGGLHMIDISTPLNPVYAGCFAEQQVRAIIRPGYVHDAQCVMYSGPDTDYNGKEICFNASETALVIADVDDKSDPRTISFKGYERASYAHQGWLTEDHRYYLLNDELDENNFSAKTTTYIWDVRDLDDPVLIGSHEFATGSIDHNLYIKDGLVFEANYTSGLRILSTEQIENGQLEEVAMFDTFPVHDAPVFDGAWSSYPFFESGTVVVSDMSGGLFVLHPTLPR